MASSMENALSLAGLLTGGGKNSTTTTSKSVSQEAINATIKKQLESTQGLASITGGEKSAGLYNSTVATQLVNDLLSRTAGEAASQTASTTQKVTGANGGGKQALTGLGLLALTDKDFQKTAKAGIQSLSDVLQGIGSSSVPTSAGLVGEALLSGEPISSTLSATDVLFGGGADVASGLATAVEAVPTDTTWAEDVGEAVSSGWDWLTSWW